MNNLLFRAFRASETSLHELNYLFWECTTRCSLRCRHCGSDCVAAGSAADMPLSDFLAALDTIPKSAISKEFTVAITGGEPLLRPDLCEAGKEIRKRGMRWGMVTNGYFYTEQKHGELMAAGMGSVTVSLDGMQDSHDWMRGREGSFERAVRAIGIAAAQPHLAFDVVTCVNKRNINELEDMFQLLNSLGVKHWRIFTIIPIGRAASDPDMHLSDTEYVRLLEFIKAHRQKNDAPLRVQLSCEGYVGPYEEKVRDTPYFCHAGINIASVLIDGTICACPNVDREAFAQGNIHTDSLWEVWNTRFQTFRDRAWTRKGECKDCRAWKMCLGNGMHNWHGDCTSVLNCHLHKIERAR